MSKRRFLRPRTALIAVSLAAVALLGCVLPGPETGTLYPISFTSALPYPSDGRYSVAVVHTNRPLLSSVFLTSAISDSTAAATSELGLYPFTTPDAQQDSWWSAKLAQTAAFRFLGRKTGPVYPFVSVPKPGLVPGDQVVDVSQPSVWCKPGCVRAVRRANTVVKVKPVDDVGVIGLPADVASTTELPRTPVFMSGFSSGLTYTLAYLDGFTPGDLSAGRSIGGTGTMGMDGKVGPILNVDVKTAAAVRAQVDVFFVPRQNFVRAQQVASGSPMRVVPVAALSDAVRVLCAQQNVSDAACAALKKNDQAASKAAKTVVDALTNIGKLVVTKTPKR